MAQKPKAIVAHVLPPPSHTAALLPCHVPPDRRPPSSRPAVGCRPDPLPAPPPSTSPARTRPPLLHAAVALQKALSTAVTTVDGDEVKAANTATAPLGELPPRHPFNFVRLMLAFRPQCCRSPSRPPGAAAVIGIPSLLRRRTASPVIDFPSEPHPPSHCSTCSPLLTHARAASTAAPHRPVHRCELCRRVGHDRGDCGQHARRVLMRGQLGQLGRLCWPHARPVADAAAHGKQAASLRGHGPKAEYRPRTVHPLLIYRISFLI
jgi:hypothetical protein